MKESAARLRAGSTIEGAMAAGQAMIENAGFKLDYFEVRHAENAGADHLDQGRPVRMLVAARLGTTRLIDNIAV